jgi:outer membrane biosynthesis protein TonB
MRKSLAISAVAHAVALLWGLITFNATPFEAAEPMSIPIEFVSATEFSKMTAGTPDAAKRDAPKQKVEKIAEKKPVQDTSDKVSEKPEIVTASTEPPPTPETKKPDPKAKPVQQAEAKPEKAEKVEQKVDPIAEALKKEEKKEKESEQKQAEAKATPLPPKRPAPPQPKFDPSKIQSVLLDKRDPRRQAMAGEVMNDSSSLGAPTGNSPELSQDEIAALRARISKLWNPPIAFAESGIRITFRVQIGRDRRLIARPEVVTTTGGRGQTFEAARDAAIRALLQAQPFDMLRSETFETWRDMEVVFDPSLMFRG